MNDEERAREIYREALGSETSENIHDVIPRMFAAALAAERERCAVIAERREGISGMVIAKAIRALGEEK